MENTNPENALQAETLQSVEDTTQPEISSENVPVENLSSQVDDFGADVASEQSLVVETTAEPSSIEITRAVNYVDDTTEEIEDDEAEEVEDFTNRSLSDLVKMARDLAKSEDWQKTNLIFQALRNEVERLLKNETEVAKAQFIADGSPEEDFKYKRPALYDEFFKYYEEFKANRSNFFENVKKEREKSLAKKQALIIELREIIDKGDGKGINRVREIQKEWREAGVVPKSDAENLYQTYHALLNRFYDMKSIESDLKDLDRKRNYDLKLEIVQKAEKLLLLDSLSEAVKQLNKLHEEFKVIGPVIPEEREAIWSRFKAASDKIYEEKRRRSEEFKATLNLNMKLKQELCLKIEEYLTFDSDKIKEWNEKTKEVVALQDEWQKIGAIPKEVSKDINKQFWNTFKLFFQKKNEFFDALEAERNENLAKKVALCEEAEALQESTDWNATADKIKELQEAWKKIGTVPEKQRDSIYERFKKACDTFFERKRNSKNSKEKEFEDNLAKKNAICQEITNLAKTGTFDKDKITEYINQFFAIGYVPKKDMHANMDKFMQTVDSYFDKVQGIDETEREKARIEALLAIYQHSPNAGERLEKREIQLRRKIEALENDIALWENNLTFFAKSRTADKLRDEFSAKVASAQTKVAELKAQLKMLRTVTKSTNPQKQNDRPNKDRDSINRR